MILLDKSFWRRLSPNFPNMHEYMAIFPEPARIVSAVAIRDDPTGYAPIAVDYEELGAGCVRTRLRPDSDWYHTTFMVEGEILCWTHEGKEWPWEKISRDELPEWFSEFAAKALRRMDERTTKAKPSS